MRVVLASESPRRTELLRILLSKFTVIPSNFDESETEEREPVRFAKKVALIKAERVSEDLRDGIVIGADTIVVINKKFLKKPRDEKEAISMLLQLSGREHKVITAVAVINVANKDTYTGYEKTLVGMRKIDRKELNFYIKRGEWRDKAGAYGIQGQARDFIEYIKGDYFNVVGLPLKKLEELLYEAGYYRS